MAEDGPLLGQTLELEVGAPGHGGFCVARHEGRVVFVRHALPGEVVRAVVTEDRGGSFCRADAVEIVRPSSDRVEPPCPYAGPGRCGGCDWQHVTAAAQRELKAAVVREQFDRLGGLDVSAVLAGVEELPGGMLGWRTRVAYAVDRDGRPGLHRHRSHEVEHIAQCLLGVPGVGDSHVLAHVWEGLNGIEPVMGSDGVVSLVAHRAARRPTGRGRRPPDRLEVIEGPPLVAYVAGGRPFEVSASGFWQVHPAALDTFAAALLDGLSLRPGESVLDLYAGAGALTAVLAGAVGATGRVVGLESSRQAVADAQRNLADLPWAEVRQAVVTPATMAGAVSDRTPDVIVLDPPRSGAGQPVMTALVASGARAIGYVACDPAALARDVRVAVDAGWSLASLRAFDAFPMTHHVECIAILEPPKTH